VVFFVIQLETHRVLSDENLLGGIVRVDSELRAFTKVELRLPLDGRRP
jgi:hypothetical protein